jgi:hypothetical protein
VTVSLTPSFSHAVRTGLPASSSSFFAAAVSNFRPAALNESS